MLTKILMVMLGVTNMDTSVAFYRDLLGLELTSQSAEFAFFSGGGVTLALNAALGKAVPPAKSSVEIVFPVDSVAAAHRKLSERGCKFLNPPREVNPGNWAATFSDPDGHVLSVYGPK
jgi:predicted enzyme related to lactoylglutathione lyase